MNFIFIYFEEGHSEAFQIIVFLFLHPTPSLPFPFGASKWNFHNQVYDENLNICVCSVLLLLVVVEVAWKDYFSWDNQLTSIGKRCENSCHQMGIFPFKNREHWRNGRGISQKKKKTEMKLTKGHRLQNTSSS